MKRLCIMLPPELEAWAKAEAKRQGVSFNEICRRGLEAERRRSKSEGGIFDFGFTIDADVPADFSVRPERHIDPARRREGRRRSSSRSSNSQTARKPRNPRNSRKAI